MNTSSQLMEQHEQASSRLEPDYGNTKQEEKGEYVEYSDDESVSYSTNAEKEEKEPKIDCDISFDKESDDYSDNDEREIANPQVARFILPDPESLDKMTKSQLFEISKKLNIRGMADKPKAVILERVRNEIKLRNLDPKSLDNMTHKQLKELCKMLGVLPKKTYPGKAFLLKRLRNLFTLPDQESLDNMTRFQLIILCRNKKLNIDGMKNKSKAYILERVRNEINNLRQENKVQPEPHVGNPEVGPTLAPSDLEALNKLTRKELDELENEVQPEPNVGNAQVGPPSAPSVLPDPELLNKMTRGQLYELCKILKIQGMKHKNKAYILKRVRNEINNLRQENEVQPGPHVGKKKVDLELLNKFINLFS